MIALLTAMVLSQSAIGQPAYAPLDPFLFYWDSQGNMLDDAGITAYSFCILGSNPLLCFTADGGSPGAGCQIIGGKQFCPSSQFDGGIEASAVDGGAEVYGATLCNAGGCFASVPVTSACDANGYCFPQMSTPFADAGQVETSVIGSRPGQTLTLKANSSDTAIGFLFETNTSFSNNNVCEFDNSPGIGLFYIDSAGNNVFDGGGIYSDIVGWIGPHDGGGYPVNSLNITASWNQDAGGGPPGPLFTFSPVVDGFSRAIDGGYYWVLVNGGYDPGPYCEDGNTCFDQNNMVQTISAPDNTLTEDGGINARTFEAFGSSPGGNNTQPIFIGSEQAGSKEYIWANDGGNMISNGFLTNSIDVGGSIGIQCESGGLNPPICNDTAGNPLVTMSEFDGGAVATRTTMKTGTFQADAVGQTLTFVTPFAATAYYCNCHAKVFIDCEPISNTGILVAASAAAGGWWMCVGPE